MAYERSSLYFTIGTQVVAVTGGIANMVLGAANKDTFQIVVGGVLCAYSLLKGYEVKHYSLPRKEMADELSKLEKNINTLKGERIAIETETMQIEQDTSRISHI